MRPIPLLTISVAAVLAASAPASAVTISPTHVRFPQMAVGTHGRTVVAWERLTDGRFSVEARIGDGPLRLGRTRLLARVGYRPQVAVGADGTVAVEWAESGSRSGRDVRVRVAVARSGHGFGRVQTVERRRGNIWPVGVAVQPTGRVVAIWRRSNTRLAYELATRGQRFAAARGLTETGMTSPGMVAVDPRDGAIVLAYGTRPSIVPLANEQAAVRTLSPSAPAFSGPTVLSATGIAGKAAPIAVSGPAGAAVALTVSGNVAGLVLVRRSADGSWAAPQTIAVTGNVTNVFAQGLHATLPAGGAAIAAWSVVTEPTDPFALPLSRQTVASVALPGAAFGTPEPLAPGGRRFSDPSVAAAGDEAFVASATPHGPVLLAARATGAASFTPPVALTSAGDGDVLLAAGGSHVLAAYQRADRLRLRVVR